MGEIQPGDLALIKMNPQGDLDMLDDKNRPRKTVTGKRKKPTHTHKIPTRIIIRSEKVAANPVYLPNK